MIDGEIIHGNIYIFLVILCVVCRWENLSCAVFKWLNIYTLTVALHTMESLYIGINPRSKRERVKLMISLEETEAHNAWTFYFSQDAKAQLELRLEPCSMSWYCWHNNCLEHWHGKWLTGLLYHLQKQITTICIFQNPLFSDRL